MAGLELVLCPLWFVELFFCGGLVVVVAFAGIRFWELNDVFVCAWTHQTEKFVQSRKEKTWDWQ